MREKERGWLEGRQSSFNQLNPFRQPGENDQVPFTMLFSKTQFNQVDKHIHVLTITLPATSQQACKTPHVGEWHNLLPGAKKYNIKI